MILDHKIAVITPTYERPELVLRNVKAVINQKYKNWELYLINDGSKKDYTQLEELINHYSKIKYFKLAINQGLNNALNICINEIINSECEYLIIVDDDDQLTKDALKTLNSIIELYPEENWLAFNCQNISKFFCGEIKNISKIEHVQYPEEYLKKVSGDKAHVVKVACLRNNPKIRFSKYIKNGHEKIFWDKLSRISKTLLINETLKIIEYQQEGLSTSSLYFYGYFKNAKIYLFYIFDNPCELKHYRQLFQHLFGFKIWSLKNWRALLKKILGQQYYKVKNFFCIKLK